jgi:hypothetical protein
MEFFTALSRLLVIQWTFLFKERLGLRKTMLGLQLCHNRRWRLQPERGGFSAERQGCWKNRANRLRRQSPSIEWCKMASRVSEYSST